MFGSVPLPAIILNFNATYNEELVSTPVQTQIVTQYKFYGGN